MLLKWYFTAMLSMQIINQAIYADKTHWKVSDKISPCELNRDKLNQTTHTYMF